MFDGENFNAITYLVGLIAAIGLVVLIVTASRQAEVLPIVSITVYGATLVLLYAFLALNHSLRGTAKKCFPEGSSRLLLAIIGRCSVYFGGVPLCL